jgi:hypothetical protein
MIKNLIWSYDGILTEFDLKTGKGKVFVFELNKTYNFYQWYFNSGWPSRNPKVMDFLTVHFDSQNITAKPLGYRLRLRID